MRPTLRRAWQFELVYTQGRKLTCPVLVLFHLERTPDRRVAFVASRKVGNAVQRNRAKRVLRVATAQVLDELQGRVPGWLVFVARRQILACTSDEVAEALRALLNGSTEPGASRPTSGEGTA